MRLSAKLHSYAELARGSEDADQDRVRCPGEWTPELCCCDVAQGESHADVPRFAIAQDRTERRAVALAKAHGCIAVTSRDPRGAVLLLKVQSGRTNDFGQRGVVVP